MATHQFQFELLPRAPLIETYGSLPQRVVAEDFDAAWLQQPKCDVATLFDAFVERYQSWSSDIRMWGFESGNRIHVVFEGTKIVEVSCRIAVPRPFERFAAGVISVANQCDWVLILTNDAVAEPSLPTLLAAVLQSNAAKFSANRMEFLEGLATGKYSPE